MPNKCNCGNGVNVVPQEGAYISYPVVGTTNTSTILAIVEPMMMLVVMTMMMGMMKNMMPTAKNKYLARKSTADKTYDTIDAAATYIVTHSDEDPVYIGDLLSRATTPFISFGSHEQQQKDREDLRFARKVLGDLYKKYSGEDMFTSYMPAVHTKIRRCPYCGKDIGHMLKKVPYQKVWKLSVVQGPLVSVRATELDSKITKQQGARTIYECPKCHTEFDQISDDSQVQEFFNGNPSYGGI